MPIVSREPIRNRLLRALPSSTLERLRPALFPISMARGDAIDHVDGAIENLYFVNRGFVSLVKTMHDGRSVEVGGVGIEGLTDPNSLYGIETAVLDTVVQLPGAAFRIRRESLMQEMASDPALSRLMQDYSRFAYSQLAQTAACNRLHSLEERCCRWLLIAHDNALQDTFPLTHEFLAMMLGVQRSGVSIAASALRKAKLIDYRRGEVAILDRKGLEDGACECYASIQTELERIYASRPRGAEPPWLA